MLVDPRLVALGVLAACCLIGCRSEQADSAPPPPAPTSIPQAPLGAEGEDYPPRAPATVPPPRPTPPHPGPNIPPDVHNPFIPPPPPPPQGTGGGTVL